MFRLWWLREGKSRKMLHKTESCARRRLSAAMPPPRLMSMDDWEGAMYRVCAICAPGEQDRLWDLSRVDEARRK